MTDVVWLIAGGGGISFGAFLMRAAGTNKGAGALLVGSGVMLIIPLLIGLFGPTP